MPKVFITSNIISGGREVIGHSTDQSFQNPPTLAIPANNDRVSIAFTLGGKPSTDSLIGGDRADGYRFTINDPGDGIVVNHRTSYVLHAEDYPAIVQGEFYTDCALPGMGVIYTEIMCRCFDDYDFLCGCKVPPAKYDRHFYNGTQKGADDYVKIFDGNPSRVSLLIGVTYTNAGDIHQPITLSNRPNISGNWYMFDVPDNIKLPFRDFGPIIGETLYIRCNTANNCNVTAMEVFRIPN